jgi:hypothetical protein
MGAGLSRPCEYVARIHYQLGPTLGEGTRIAGGWGGGFALPPPTWLVLRWSSVFVECTYTAADAPWTLASPSARPCDASTPRVTVSCARSSLNCSQASPRNRSEQTSTLIRFMHSVSTADLGIEHKGLADVTRGQQALDGARCHTHMPARLLERWVRDKNLTSIFIYSRFCWLDQYRRPTSAEPLTGAPQLSQAGMVSSWHDAACSLHVSTGVAPTADTEGAYTFYTKSGVRWPMSWRRS